jgi:hypothetical protein
MYTIAQLFFDALCGVLFVIGIAFGLGYEEISVYVCIYLWPFLCSMMPTTIFLVALYNWIKKMTVPNTINLTASSVVSCIFWSITDYFYDAFSVGYNQVSGRIYTTHDKFIACKEALITISDNLHITYAEANLYIYCVLFLFIFVVMWFWFECTINKRLFINRIWKPKSNC